MSSIDDIAAKLDSILEVQARQHAENAQGYEHVCQRMDIAIELWTTANNRYLELVELHSRLQASVNDLGTRVHLMEEWIKRQVIAAATAARETR